MKKIVTTIVHEFNVADAEDPDIYAAQPLWEWENSEVGKWVKSRAVEVPEWSRIIDHSSFAYRYKIIARLYEEDALYFTLKFK